MFANAAYENWERLHYYVVQTTICVKESKYAELAKQEAQKYRPKINNAPRGPLLTRCCSRGITRVRSLMLTHYLALARL